MNRPCLTVLMPVYNAEKYLREAMDSILQQTLSNFEFLIIDDGSTDHSIEIIRSYHDPRIRLVQNERNLGISATLNKGIELSRTELIARMDADDISYPDRLQKQHEFFLSHPDCALLSTWAREISEDKEPLFTSKWPSAYYYYFLHFECIIYHPTVMYRKSAVIDCGKYSIPYCEDYELWWRITRKYKIYNFPEVLLDYRSSHNSLSRVHKKTEYQDGLQKLVLRNIHYYTGKSFPLTYPELAFMRFDLEPIIQQNSIHSFVQCLNKLDHINRLIEKKENINCHQSIIREAANSRKKVIVSTFSQNLSKFKLALLYIRLGYWKKLMILTINYLMKKH